MGQYIKVTEAEKEIYAIPNGVSLQEAAAMQLSLETAYQVLVDDGELEKGENILILGGSTVIGMYGIQIAKNVYNAANVTVTSSSVELCKSLGADNVVNYKEEKWEEALKGKQFDLILDVIGGSKAWKDCKSEQVLKKQGRFVTVCGDFPPDQVVSCCLVCGIMCNVMGRMCMGSCCGKQKYLAPIQSRSKFIEDSLKLVVDGKVKVMIDEEGPWELEQYLDVYKKSISRGAHGKLLMKLWENIEEEADDEKNGNDEKNSNDVQEEYNGEAVEVENTQNVDDDQ